jgi:hypothetical protein
VADATRPIPHGTLTGYATRKCRCDECKAAAREYGRKKRESGPNPGKPIPHGTQSGYSYHKCRCDDCSAVRRECSRKQREADAKPGVQVPHGTSTGYLHHRCRCDDCKTAHAEYIKGRRKPKPGTPTPHGTRSGYLYHGCRCPECKTAQSAYTSHHYLSNQEIILERGKQYRKANREKRAKYAQSKWQNDQEYRQRRYDIQHRRRARARSAFVEDVPRLEIFKRDNWQCQIPGCFYPDVPARLDVGRYHPLLASVDHIVPYAKGGLHERSNLATAHLQCNITKNDRLEGIA